MRDLCLAQKDVSTGVSTGRAGSTCTHWQQWSSFTTELGLCPLLKAVTDKVHPTGLQDMLQPSLERLKITYGQLGRRSLQWVK